MPGPDHKQIILSLLESDKASISIPKKSLEELEEEFEAGLRHIEQFLAANVELSLQDLNLTLLDSEWLRFVKSRSIASLRFEQARAVYEDIVGAFEKDMRSNCDSELLDSESFSQLSALFFARFCKDENQPATSPIENSISIYDGLLSSPERSVSLGNEHRCRLLTMLGRSIIELEDGAMRAIVSNQQGIYPAVINNDGIILVSDVLESGEIMRIPFGAPSLKVYNANVSDIYFLLSQLPKADNTPESERLSLPADPKKKPDNDSTKK